MKHCIQYKLGTLFTIAFITSAFLCSSCVKISEVPPKRNRYDLKIDLPSAPKLTAEEEKEVQRIKDEYNSHISKKNKP